MQKKTKKVNKKRPAQSARVIDELFSQTYSGLSKDLVAIKKIQIKTWQAVFAIALMAGAAVSMASISIMDYYDSTFAAEGQATLSLVLNNTPDPTAITVQQGDSFSLDVVLDALDNDVVAAKADVNFDPTVFSLESCSSADSAFGVNSTCTNSADNPVQIVVDNSDSGNIIITQGNSNPITNANAFIATLTFTALQTINPASPNITLLYNGTGSYDDSDVIINGENGEDILNEVNNVAVTVVEVPVCTGSVPAHATLCAGDATGLEESTQNSLVAACGLPYCEYTCNDGYEISGGACVSNTPEPESYECIGSMPIGDVLCLGDDTGLSADTAYSLVTACTAGTKCEYTHPEGDDAEEEVLPAGADGEIDVDVYVKTTQGTNKAKKSKTIYSKNRKFYFKGRSSDVDITGGKVAIFEGSKRKAETDVEKDGSWKLRAKSKKDGKYQYRLKYYNKNGQEIGQSSKYTVIVDTEKPVITNLPMALTKRPGDVLWWRATDNRKIDHYKYYFNGKIRETLKDSFVIPVNTPKGIHYLKVRVYDKAGNTEVRNIVVRVR